VQREKQFLWGKKKEKGSPAGTKKKTCSFNWKKEIVPCETGAGQVKQVVKDLGDKNHP